MPTERLRGLLSTHGVGMGTATRRNTVAYGFSLSLASPFGALMLIDRGSGAR